jgi:hypothetical protein
MMDKTQIQFLSIRAEIESWPVKSGIKPTDLMLLSEPLRGILNTTVRQGTITLSTFADAIDLPVGLALEVVELLVEHGFLCTSEQNDQGDRQYHVRYSRSNRKVGDVWGTVLDSLDRLPDSSPIESQIKSDTEPISTGSTTIERKKRRSVFDLLQDSRQAESQVDPQAEQSTESSEQEI